MPTCPAGHDSGAGDYCDVCGMRIDPSAAPGPDGQAAAKPASPCPHCGAGKSGRYCESCGFDFNSGDPGGAAVPATTVPATAVPAATVRATPAPGAPAPATSWTAVVTADRAHYDRVIATGGPDAAAMSFPGYCPERSFRLSGGEMRIGRRSVSRGLAPEIDLAGQPADPGISRMHAVLTGQPGGGWAVVDVGSENGTMVNHGEIPTGVPVPLRDGDRINLGAWTAITICAAPAALPPGSAPGS